VPVNVKGNSGKWLVTTDMRRWSAWTRKGAIRKARRVLAAYRRANCPTEREAIEVTADQR
jgi:hypothetical protein